MLENFSRFQFQANVLDYVSDTVIAIDNQHRIIYLNLAATKQYSVEREEAIGQPLESLYQYRWINSEDEQAASVALASTGVWKGQNIHIKRNAEEIWVESTVSVLKDEQSHQVGLLAVMRDISDSQRDRFASHKQAEAEALRQSEERFRQLAENIRDVFWISDIIESQIIYVSPAYERVWGRTCESLYAEPRSFTEAIHPEDQEVIRAALERQKQEQATDIEYRIVQPSGDIRWIHDRAFPIRNQAGVVYRFVGIAEDITVRKQAEEALCKSQELYQTLVNNFPNGAVVLFDQNLRYTIASGTELAEIGLPKESIEGKTVWEVFPPEIVALNEPAYRAVFAGKATTFEVPFAGRIYLVRTLPIRNELGEVYAGMVMTQNITDRKHAQQERDRFFNLSLDLLMIGNFQGYFTHLNLAWERILGWTREELKAQPFLERVHPADREATQDRIKKLVDGIPLSGFENRYCCKDGSYKWLSWTAVPFLEEGLIYGVARDVSAQKQAEEEQQKFVALIENSRDFIGMATLDEKPFFVNEAGRQLVGLDSLEEVRSIDIFDFHTPESQVYFREIVIPICRATGRWEGEGVFRHFKTGKPIDVYINSFLVKNPQSGEPICIATVTRDITERKQAEEKIKASLQEKEVLLKEIHHRVKNNLQIVYSLLDLQSQQIQDRQTLEMFREIQNRIRSMALIHEKLYESENLHWVNSVDYIHSLITYLFQSYAINPDNITLQINVDEVFLNIDTAIPCGLLLNELVSNVLQHGFTGSAKGTVWVGLYLKDHQLHLTVKNDRVKSKDLRDFSITKSLGLQLVDVFVKQIEGQIEIDYSQGLAFKVRFDFPDERLSHAKD